MDTSSINLLKLKKEHTEISHSEKSIDSKDEHAALQYGKE